MLSAPYTLYHVLFSSLFQHFLGLSAHSLSFHLFCPSFLPFFFLQSFPPSPIGGRRKWKEDVEESGFSFDQIRWASIPKEKGQKPLSLEVLSYPPAISVLASWKMSKTPHAASVLAETHCVKAMVRTVISYFGFQCLEGLWWHRQSYQELPFRSGAFALLLKNCKSVWIALPDVFLITSQVWKCWK